MSNRGKSDNDNSQISIVPPLVLYVVDPFGWHWKLLTAMLSLKL